MVLPSGTLLLKCRPTTNSIIWNDILDRINSIYEFPISNSEGFEWGKVLMFKNT